MWSEFLRGNFGIQKQFQACVRRRANISVQGNPHCRGDKGQKAVDLVLDGCLADTAPLITYPDNHLGSAECYCSLARSIFCVTGRQTLPLGLLPGFHRQCNCSQ